MKSIEGPYRQSLVATALVMGALASLFFESFAQETRVTALRSPAMIADDVGIVEKIRTALREDTELAGNPIRVSSSHGMVVLAGTVADAAQVERAVDLALRVPGVMSVSAKIGYIAPDTVTTRLPRDEKA